jgi:serine protease
LLYSAPCTSFMALAHADPAAAALQIKQYILDGVDPNASLNGITVTGGRLNVFNSLTELLNSCSAGGCVTPFSLHANSVTDTSGVFTWNSVPDTSGFDFRYKSTADSIWTVLADTASPVKLTSLSACTEYEFQVIAICETDSSLWSQSYIFTTDGCCLPPSGLSVSGVTDSSATLGWNDLLAANAFNIQIRPSGAGAWVTYSGITEDSLIALDLEPCKEYEFQVQTVCDTGETTFSEIFTFTTKGCGACLDLNYCQSNGEDATGEWIRKVQLNQINNTSNSNNGYGDYTSISSILGWNQLYSIKLTPGYSGQTYNEVFRVWIDYNQNGSFNDSGELVYASGTTTTATTGTFTVPPTATLGSTRMRVSMKFSSPPQQCSNPFDFGEVEDYCVEIIENDSAYIGIASLEPMMNVVVYPNPFMDAAVMEFSNPGNENFSLNILDVQGRIVQSYGNIRSEKVFIEKKNLTSGMYFFELRDSRSKIQARGKVVLR